MSALTNEASKRVLGLTYTPVEAYLPGLVAAADARPAARVPGLERRAEELALARAA
jgi:hypothetical protein